MPTRRCHAFRAGKNLRDLCIDIQLPKGYELSLDDWKKTAARRPCDLLSGAPHSATSNVSVAQFDSWVSPSRSISTMWIRRTYHSPGSPSSTPAVPSSHGLDVAAVLRVAVVAVVTRVDELSGDRHAVAKDAELEPVARVERVRVDQRHDLDRVAELSRPRLAALVADLKDGLDVLRVELVGRLIECARGSSLGQHVENTIVLEVFVELFRRELEAARPGWATETDTRHGNTTGTTV